MVEDLNMSNTSDVTSTTSSGLEVVSENSMLSLQQLDLMVVISSIGSTLPRFILQVKENSDT